MPRLVAFLRAINVGGHTVKMDALRRLFEAQSFANVETFIASGNVVFDSRTAPGPKLEARIEAALREALGYEVATFLRTTREVTAIAAHQPFRPADRRPGANLYVGLVRAPLGAGAKRTLEGFRTAIDTFEVQGREVWWQCLKGQSESKFSGAVFEKALGVPATFRNVTTMRKLAAKHGA